ncbi:UDP-N-acetyl-D-mannosamine dehydrogenase [Yersinia intermedia]|uniref:nucleotide sugar dehydrogenase n=1 Tax=Yersinia intermedia TaxID=631 RepID=UPI0005E2B27B|nr:nucleotide sugar dehydrogenase [Yersinia intermedia]CNI50020.1 UDP-N-acetyl-D-mannosamine dehydrogenase [Yersinia intermedia]
MNLTSKKIAIIGLGYVGLPLAVEFGKKQPTLGFDISNSRISELRTGKDNTLEVSSDELMGVEYIEYSNDIEDLKSCDVFIITVPTPIDDVKRPDLIPLLKASESVGKSLKKGAVVIYESTVYPGCTEEVCVPILEKYSGMIFNTDFYCGYSPERINPGDKVNTLTKIKKITSGSTPEAAEAINILYASIITAGTYLAASIKVAEAAKVIENTQRDLNIALVNELSIIFDRLNIDTLEVLEAAGTKWNFLPFRPGMVGGHCIGVDPYYLTHKAEQVGYNPQVILAGRRINDNMARYAARNVIKLMLNNGVNVASSRVGIMGITFKENCPDIRNSKVIDLINELIKWNVDVVVEDAWADEKEVFEEYSIKLNKITSDSNIDAIIIAVAHDEYKKIDLRYLRQICNGSKPVLADLKGIFNKSDVTSSGFELFRF